ncbi:MAG: glycosyltransferase family 9 protein [Planctomycetes bacterium]|nr:glycosyltransferase family 9 protein [Planctomycetota bacterium]
MIRIAEVKNIAVITLVGPGSTILFLPALEKMREVFPAAKIDVLTPINAVADMFSEHPLVNRVVRVADRKDGNFFDRIRTVFTARSIRPEDSRRYDVSFTIYPSNRIHYNVLAWLVGAKVRITHGYEHGKLKTLAFLQNHPVPTDVTKHDVENNLALLREFTSDLAPPERISFHLTEGARRFAEEFWDARPKTRKYRVGFHVTSFPDMTYKRWPEDHYVRLFDLLDADATCHLFGGPDEAAELRRIAARAKNPAEVIAIPLVEAAAVMSHLDAFVSNDSGLMHVAAAVGIPTLGIFGPTNLTRTKPWGLNARVIQYEEHLACRPCHVYPAKSVRLKPGCPELTCLTEIPPERVLSKVLEMLATC